MTGELDEAKGPKNPYIEMTLALGAICQGIRDWRPAHGTKEELLLTIYQLSRNALTVAEEDEMQRKLAVPDALTNPIRARIVE